MGIANISETMRCKAFESCTWLVEFNKNRAFSFAKAFASSRHESWTDERKLIHGISCEARINNTASVYRSCNLKQWNWGKRMLGQRNVSMPLGFRQRKFPLYYSAIKVSHGLIRYQNVCWKTQKYWQEQRSEVILMANLTLRCFKKNI